jgi:hypothetical protein
MMVWTELLRSELGLSQLQPGDTAVPFGVPPVDRRHWKVRDLRQANGQWELLAVTEHGLEASCRFRFFPDTRSVETWGTIRHRGTDVIRGIRELLILDAPLPLSPDFDRPWIRSVNGTRLFPTYFPPHDFGVIDRQLLNAGALNGSLMLSNGPTGRSSAETLPVAILGDQSGTAGLALMLEWSGSWSMGFSLGAPRVGDPSFTETDLPRVAEGVYLRIGAWGLGLDLRPGEELPLPRLLISAYEGDLEAGGNALRRHVRRHVAPSLNGEEVRPPTSYNQFFAFANDFSAASLKPAVTVSETIGLEAFVVDAGWFEDDFPVGTGNWDRVSSMKFPGGMRPFADFVGEHGMRFGMWFEPEWAHEGSQLHREHPEWFWETPPLPPIGDPTGPGFLHGVTDYLQGENYLMMDFGLPEVQAWWLEHAVRAHREWGIRWLKWDFNHHPRPNWEHDVPAGQIGWRQIRHIAGLYGTLDAIMAECPDLLIEQCAGGGHRMDLGMIRRGHTYWIDDVDKNSDLNRAFQHGINTVLPGNYANVNLCLPGYDFSDYDYLSHSAGPFGLTGPLWDASPSQLESLAGAVSRFTDFRHLLLGDFARPTGQPTRADGYAQVVFSDGGESVSMEFNHDGPGSARLTRG